MDLLIKVNPIFAKIQSQYIFWDFYLDLIKLGFVAKALTVYKERSFA